MSEIVPVAYMRKWAFDGEIPKKELNANGCMAWPWKFKFASVTVRQVFHDDIPLCAIDQAIARAGGG